MYIFLSLINLPSNYNCFTSSGELMVFGGAMQFLSSNKSFHVGLIVIINSKCIMRYQSMNLEYLLYLAFINCFLSGRFIVSATLKN